MRRGGGTAEKSRARAGRHHLSRGSQVKGARMNECYWLLLKLLLLLDGLYSARRRWLSDFLGALFCERWFMVKGNNRGSCDFYDFGRMVLLTLSLFFNFYFSTKCLMLAKVLMCSFHFERNGVWLLSCFVKKCCLTEHFCLSHLHKVPPRSDFNSRSYKFPILFPFFYNTHSWSNFLARCGKQRTRQCLWNLLLLVRVWFFLHYFWVVAARWHCTLPFYYRVCWKNNSRKSVWFGSWREMGFWCIYSDLKHLDWK